MKKFTTSTLAALCCAGKMISVGGQNIFVYSEGLKDLGVTNAPLMKGITLIATVSSIYVIGFTRGPALKRFFSSTQSGDKMSLWHGNTLLQKFTVLSVGSLNIVVACTEGFQAYLGSNSLLKAFKLADGLVNILGENYGNDTIILINSSLALSCLFAHLAFYSGKSVRNSLLLAKNLQETDLMLLGSKKTLLNSFKSLGTSIFAAIAKAVFVYYGVSASLELIWPSMPTPLLIGTVGFISLSNFMTFIPSQTGEIFKYFNSTEKPLLKTYCKDIESKKDQLIVAPHWLFGSIDVTSFMLTTLFSLLAIFSAPGGLFLLLFGLICLSAGFTNYVFSIRPMIKSCIDHRESYHPTITDESQKNTSFFSSWCCMFEHQKQLPKEESSLMLNQEESDNYITSYDTYIKNAI